MLLKNILIEQHPNWTLHNSNRTKICLNFDKFNKFLTEQLPIEHWTFAIWTIELVQLTFVQLTFVQPTFVYLTFFTWHVHICMKLQYIPVIVPEVGPPKNWHYKWLALYQIFLWISSPIFDTPLGSQSSAAIETKSAVPRRARKKPDAGARETRKTIADF